VQFGLKQVWFMGVVGNILRDADGSRYAPPQWTTSYSHPVAYPRNDEMEAYDTVTISDTSWTGTLLFKGDGSNGISFPVRTNNVPGSSTELTFVMQSTTLPNQVTVLRSFSVNWQWQVDEEGESWQSVGSSVNTVYVLLGWPASGTPLYRTVMEHACGTPGATTATAAFNNTWSRFTSKAVKTWDNRTLYYYQPNVNFASHPSDIAGLLATGRGQCGAWLELFGYSLTANGLTVTTVEVTPSAAPTETHLLVKNWTKQTGTQPPPYSWRITSFQSTSYFEMVPLPAGNDFGDLVSATGIAGQNSATPSEKVFVLHYILRYGSKYYDPSYGVMYHDEFDMEDDAVHGFAAHPVSGANFYQLDIRDATGDGSLWFTEFAF
jgi:hypothetical protein